MVPCSRPSDEYDLASRHRARSLGHSHTHHHHHSQSHPAWAAATPGHLTSPRLANHHQYNSSPLSPSRTSSSSLSFSPGILPRTTRGQRPPLSTCNARLCFSLRRRLPPGVHVGPCWIVRWRLPPFRGRLQIPRNLDTRQPNTPGPLLPAVLEETVLTAPCSACHPCSRPGTGGNRPPASHQRNPVSAGPRPNGARGRCRGYRRHRALRARTFGPRPSTRSAIARLESSNPSPVRLLPLSCLSESLALGCPPCCPPCTASPAPASRRLFHSANLRFVKQPMVTWRPFRTPHCHPIMPAMTSPTHPRARRPRLSSGSPSGSSRTPQASPSSPACAPGSG